jgi:hypothetical protein
MTVGVGNEPTDYFVHVRTPSLSYPRGVPPAGNWQVWKARRDDRQSILRDREYSTKTGWIRRRIG